MYIGQHWSFRMVSVGQVLDLDWQWSRHSRWSPKAIDVWNRECWGQVGHMIARAVESEVNWHPYMTVVGVVGESEQLVSALNLMFDMAVETLLRSVLRQGYSRNQKRTSYVLGNLWGGEEFDQRVGYHVLAGEGQKSFDRREVELGAGLIGPCFGHLDLGSNSVWKKWSIVDLLGTLQSSKPAQRRGDTV